MQLVYEALARNWALVLILLTIAVVVIVPALVLMRYVRISLNIMRSTKPPLARAPLDYEPLEGEPVQFPAFDGLPLSGMVIRAEPPGPARGLIMFCHEYCSDMQSCARYCRPLTRVGYDVFTFDFRNHGQSASETGYTPRQWLTEREVADIRGAVAYAHRWLASEGRPAELGLFGISRGACTAVMAAAESDSVKAIVLDGAFSTDTTIEYFMKRWAYIFASVRVLYENHPPAFWRFLRWVMIRFAQREFGCSFPSVRKAVRRMRPRPIFFIHGEKDSYLPEEQSRMLYALAADPRELWIVPGARHNQAVIRQPERYAARTIAFFDRALGGEKPVRKAAAEPGVAAPASTPDPRPAAL